MAVYIGDIEWPFRNMIMFHMVADTEEELHTMADKIGVQRQWHQPYPDHLISHYDISKDKKQLALKNGAVELSDRIMVKKFGNITQMVKDREKLATSKLKSWKEYLEKMRGK